MSRTIRSVAVPPGSARQTAVESRIRHVLPRPGPALAVPGLCTLLAVALLAAATVVARAEAAEQDVESALDAAAPATGPIAVEGGAHVLVEVCVSPAPRGAEALALLVEAPVPSSPSAVVAVRTLSEATLGAARRGPDGACWTAHEGVSQRRGVVQVRLADGEDLAARAVVARVHLRGAPSAWEPLVRLAVALAALALALAVARRVRTPEVAPPSTRGRAGALVVLALGVACAAAASHAVRYVGDVGASGGFARGLSLAVTEVALAFALAAALARHGHAPTAGLLGLHGPRGGGVALAASVATGAVCAVAATALLRFVPGSPIDAPIEVFVARPSGALAFGAMALAVPLAEEVFFRGFVHGSAARALGAPAAVVASSTLFVLAHAPQAWGAWGGLGAVALLGTTLALLRAVTGSCATTMLAHLAYNVVLTAPGWFPAAE